jgi:hypothetical protein
MTDDESDEVTSARHERERAEQQERDIRGRWPELMAAFMPLIDMRKKNHFADQLRAAFEGRRGA